MKRSEADIASFVREWLIRGGWECYQEVAMLTGRADIVAVKASMVWIVETKTSFSLKLLYQCRDRLREKCTGVVAAVPFIPYKAMPILSELGIGGMHAGSDCCELKVWPALRRIDTTKLRESLHEEQKSFAQAGTNGEYWTKFKGFVRDLQRELRPGLLSDVMRGLDCVKGYKKRSASAHRRAVADYLDRGLIPGWALKRNGRVLEVVSTSGGGQ